MINPSSAFASNAKSLVFESIFASNARSLPLDGIESHAN